MFDPLSQIMPYNHVTHLIRLFTFDERGLKHRPFSRDQTYLLHVHFDNSYWFDLIWTYFIEYFSKGLGTSSKTYFALSSIDNLPRAKVLPVCIKCIVYLNDVILSFT